MDVTGTPDSLWPTDWPDGPLELDEALALAATLIPPGQATSYGGLAAALGAGGPRQAGRAMSRAPEGTPWWRVVRADGSLPSSLASRAAAHWRAEGTPQRAHSSAGFPDDGRHLRLDLASARWSPGAEDELLLRALRERIG